eukprot:CAMPEP_0183743390 /NCGR_PEP_ID=MMETSP0737-20130205/65195_1 /TAXON_ID=385413 /ORGANISM="Thalassiosira miniscula, Strain CCMP1093" /LENGTH=851 /DNA_ID=CAMNT_0025979009 /DNA_START=158 /DNA_END=2713 /DNA_ORIENTATION=-
MARLTTPMALSALAALLATLLLPSCHGIDLATLPIPTFRLDLTIKNQIKNQRRLLLRGSSNSNGDDNNINDNNNNSDNPRRELVEDSDLIIGSVAEKHLAAIYAQAFADISPPSQVLLTVTPDGSAVDDSEVGGIYIRSLFLGGVVTFPDTRSEDAPSKSQLERVTLKSFQIPGAGEPFLKALEREDHPDLRGLLVLTAVEVAKSSEEDDEDEVAAADPSPSVMHETNESSMNIWAIAAVAALGAMFCVIILCTSILYCDWRKRKERRERKRERSLAMANAAAAANGSRWKKGSAASKSSGKSVEIHNEEMLEEPPQLQLRSEELNIVVQATRSGETEGMIDTPSPSTQGSNENDHTTFEPNNKSTRGGSVFHKLKSSRKTLSKAVGKSKAVNAQLQQDDSMSSSNAAQSQEYTTSEEYNADGILGGTAASELAPSVITGDYSAIDYNSVGEDTTMLYPAFNRGRLGSKDKNNADAMSDFDGYSMDGMSAIGPDGGFSTYGGSAGGSGHGSTDLLRKRGSSTTENMPRDFDSVWGDDDQSRITTDGSILDFTNAKNGHKDNNVKDTKKEAYGDLTKNLDELVENEYESSSQSNIGSSAAGGAESTVNLHEFDSGSESGSANRGAFTLELLGKGGGKKGSAASAATPSQDDEDSILGNMYKDETLELGLPGDDDDGDDSVLDRAVPGSGDSVDSTPSWAAPIHSALRNSVGIFRTASSSADDKDKASNDDAASASSSQKESQEQRTKEKFVSSLHSGSSHGSSDDGSVGSHRSGGSNGARSHGSHGSNHSGGSGKGHGRSTRKETTARSSEDKALGLTNSMEEEVDEDPAAMIDNINSMLSECREILDTENK